MRCFKSPDGWLMSHNQYVLDCSFTAQAADLGNAMGQLQSGVGLASNHPLFRKMDRRSS